MPDTLGDGDSPDAAGPSEATASKPSKKSKKKKSKKKATAVTDTSNAASTDANAASTDANAAQPNTIQPEATKPNTSRLIADVLEMSHPHPGNEVGKPLFAFTGTKGSAGTGASSSDKAKVKIPQRYVSDNHLVQARPLRRVHPRVKHHTKSSSDASDSREVSIQSHGQARQQSLSTQNEAENEQSNVCTFIPLKLPFGHSVESVQVLENNDDEQGERPKFWIIFTVQDPVDRSRAKLQELEEQERMLKRVRKLKEFDTGRIIGEAEEEDENGDENNGVESVGVLTN